MQLARTLVVVAIAGCHGSPDAPPPTPTIVAPAPPPIGVLYERLLPAEPRTTVLPLFGADLDLTVGSRRWSRDGRYLGIIPLGYAGQRRILAVLGPASARRVVAVDQENGHRTRLLNAPWGGPPTMEASIDRDFLAAAPMLSPDTRRLAWREGNDITVRMLDDGRVIRRIALGTKDHSLGAAVCWLGSTAIAWTEGTALRTVDLATGREARHDLPPLAADGALICDPDGGAAAITTATHVVLVDLATGAALASLAVTAGADHLVVALAGHGRHLAIADRVRVRQFRRDGAQLVTTFDRAWPTPPRALRFAPDGAQLAVLGPTLVVLGPAGEAAPTAPVPKISFTLPAGSPRPCRSVGPTPTATATYALKIGRTDGMPWFETKEIWRDGCKPYDGYTKVVIDHGRVFVVRALTTPGGAIASWLSTFFDLPFHVRTKLARRRGPSMGPC